MLSTLSPQEFVELAETETQQLLCSLYFPLDSSGLDLRAKKLQLKNAVTRVRQALTSWNGRADTAAVIEALEGLESHEQFLSPASHGLALLVPCSDPQSMKVLGLNFRPEPMVSLGDHYTVAPLLRLFASDRPRTVLALADNSLRLFKGTARQLELVDLPESFPSNREQSMRFERASGLDPKHSTQHRMGPGMASHGAGPKESVEAEFSKRYYREIGQALSGTLVEGETILLAGVHDQIALFRRVNADLPLLFSEIAGNYEGQPSEILRDKALAALSEVERAEMRLAVAETRELGSDWWATNIDPCRQAAQAGRVQTLFVNEVSLTEPTMQELVLEVLKHGGAVFSLEREDLDTACLARFRWSDAPGSASNVPV